MKRLDCLVGKMAFPKIRKALLSHIRLQKAAVEIIGGKRRRLHHRRRFRFPLAILRRHLLGRQLDVRHLGQLFHRFVKGNIFHFLEKRKHIPAHMTAEAVEHPAIRRHGKRRGLLMMKRAATPVAISFFLQRHIRRDHVLDASALPHAINDIRRYPHICPPSKIKNTDISKKRQCLLSVRSASELTVQVSECICFD